MTELLLPGLVLAGYAAVPGLVLGLAAGLRGHLLVAFAPAASLGIMAMASVGAGPIGLRWGPLAIALATAVVSGAAWLARTAARAWGRKPGPADASSVDEVAQGSRALTAAALGALGVAVAVWAWLLVRVFPTASSFSQTYDNVFHLSVIRFMYETGNGSPVLPVGLANDTPGTTIYPALWHAFTALAVPVSGDVAIATNAAILVTCGVVWTCSLVALLSVLTRPRPVTLVAAGVVSAAIPAFPLLLIKWGVLYPSLLGYALLPVVVAGAVALLRVGRRDLMDPTPVVLVSLVALPGFVLAHPSAVVLAMWVLLPAAAVSIWRLLRSRWTTWSPVVRVLVAVGQAAVAALVVLAWVSSRPDWNAWPPVDSKLPALWEAITVAPLSGTPNVAVALLAAGGLAVAAYRSRFRWLVVSWAIIVGLWVVVAAWAAGPFRTALTATWYSDPPRLAAAVGIVAGVLALLGVDAAVRFVEGRLRTRDGRQPSTASRSVAAAGAVLGLLLATQASPGMTTAVKETRGAYEWADPDCVLGDLTCLVTADERELLRRLPGLIEDGAVVFTIPTNGSSLAYALEGVPVAWTYISEPARPEVLTILQRLDSVPAGDPEICAAVDSSGIRYVLDFGTTNVSGETESHPGVDDLGPVPSVELVDEVGEARLYRIIGCP